MTTTFSPDEQQRRSTQLQRLMVQWRYRLNRGEFPWLPARKAYVTQVELAALSGIAHSYYGCLERGELDRNYSDDTLDVVAAVLRLSTSERIALYYLATGREPRPRPYAPPKITPAVVADLECKPWPAFIADATWTVLICNQASWNWFPHLRYETNLMRALFCLPEVRAALVDWASVHVVQAVRQLRARMTRLPDHDGLRRLVNEVLAASPEARSLWDTDPSVWMHEDGSQRRLLLPGAAEPTTVEVLSKTPQRNPDLCAISMVPIGGYIPAPCQAYLTQT